MIWYARHTLPTKKQGWFEFCQSRCRRKVPCKAPAVIPPSGGTPLYRSPLQVTQKSPPPLVPSLDMSYAAAPCAAGLCVRLRRTTRYPCSQNPPLQAPADYGAILHSRAGFAEESARGVYDRTRPERRQLQGALRQSKIAPCKQKKFPASCYSILRSDVRRFCVLQGAI